MIQFKPQLEAELKRDLSDFDLIKNPTPQRAKEIEELKNEIINRHKRGMEKLLNPFWFKTAKTEIEAFKADVLYVGNKSKDEVFNSYMENSTKYDRLPTGSDYQNETMLAGIAKLTVDKDIIYFVCSIRYCKTPKRVEIFANLPVVQHGNHFHPLGFDEYYCSVFSSKNLFTLSFLNPKSDYPVNQQSRFLNKTKIEPEKFLKKLFPNLNVPEWVNTKEMPVRDKQLKE